MARREQKLAEKTVFNRRVAKDTGRIKGEVSLLQVRFAYARTNARAHTRMHAHARARANRNTHTHTHTNTHRCGSTDGKKRSWMRNASFG